MRRLGIALELIQRQGDCFVRRQRSASIPSISEGGLVELLRALRPWLAPGATQTLGNNVDTIMGYSGFFGFFSKGLLLGMNWLHSTLRLSYGWAIIAITVFIKLVFWPLTQASTRSAKRMQALQPQIKALQEKHKDDPVKAQRKMMEFWKENKVNPMSGCLPTLIQMPVFIEFFYMIRSAIELRGASWFRAASISAAFSGAIAVKYSIWLSDVPTRNTCVPVFTRYSVFFGSSGYRDSTWMGPLLEAVIPNMRGSTTFRIT